MAPRAPKPGGTRRARTRRRGFKVTIGDDSWILRTADIGPGDDYMVRRQTGTPLSQFLTGDAFGLDSVAAIVWLARRKAGESRLSWQRVLEEMPSFEEIADLTAEDRFELEVLEDTDEVVDVDSEEVVPDPLPLGEA